jgi:ParB family chromosome partitioning protein
MPRRMTHAELQFQRAPRSAASRTSAKQRIEKLQTKIEKADAELDAALDAEDEDKADA